MTSKTKPDDSLFIGAVALGISTLFFAGCLTVGIQRALNGNTFISDIGSFITSETERTEFIRNWETR